MDSAKRSRWLWVCGPALLGALATTLSCQLEPPEYVGKECSRSTDCPQPLSCVVARPGGDATCEFLSGPLELAPPPPTFYCSDVKKVMADYCVACHAATPSQGAPATSRLDIWEDTTVDGKTVRGVGSMGAAIIDRTVSKGDMPPSTFPVQATPEAKRILTAWGRNKFPIFNAADGGVNCVAGGGGMDGGTKSGGGASAVLTNPGTGAQTITGTTVLMRATAAVTTGTVARVEFYQGTTKVGEDATAPYEFSWTGFAAGTYQLTARAVSDTGATGDSTPATLTVTAAPAGNTVYSVSIITTGGVILVDPVVDNATYKLADLGAAFAFRANVVNIPAAGSVRFDLDATTGAATENMAPYCMGPGAVTDCANVAVGAGMHTLVSNPFDATAAGGAAGTPKTVRFTLQ